MDSKTTEPEKTGSGGLPSDERDAPLPWGYSERDTSAQDTATESGNATVAHSSEKSTTLRTLAMGAFLVPALLVVLQTVLGLVGKDVRDLWVGTETLTAALYSAMSTGSSFFVPYLGGAPFADAMPGYLWFLGLVDTVPGLDAPRLLFVASAISGVLLVMATWLLARALGYSREIALAASLALLSTSLFVCLTHHVNGDLLFASVVALSHACLCRGWQKKSAPIWLAGGFLLAVLACAIKGPLGIMFPLLTSLLFLLWRGTFRRAGGRDGAFAFGVMLALLGAWLMAVMLQPEGKTYLTALLGRNVFDPLATLGGQQQPWWLYVAALAAGWFPWILVILFLPWERLPLVIKGMYTARAQAPGHGWAWLALLGGLAALSLFSVKPLTWIIPLYPFMAILLAQGVLSLTPGRGRAFTAVLGIILLVTAFLTGLAAAYPYIEQALPAFLRPETYFDLSAKPAAEVLRLVLLLKGPALPIMATAMLLAALLLLNETRQARTTTSVLIVACLSTVLAQPLALYVAPALNPEMSPRMQAREMQAENTDGMRFMTYALPPGMYSYYAGLPVVSAESPEELLQGIATRGPLFVAMPRSAWDAIMANNPNTLREFQTISSSPIKGQDVLLAVRRSAPVEAQSPPGTGGPGIGRDETENSESDPEAPLPSRDSEPSENRDEPSAAPLEESTNESAPEVTYF